MDLFSIGDIKRDVFISIPSASTFCEKEDRDCKMCIAYGEKIPVHEIEMQIAGSAPNVAVGLAKQGFKAGVISNMGNDSTYYEAVSFLKEYAVKPLVQKTEGAVSSFAAVLNYQGESTQLAAHKSFKIELPSKINAKFVHVSELGENFEDLFEDLIHKKDKQGFNISFNPGAFQIHSRHHSLYRLIERSDILFVNRKEAEEITETKDLQIADLMRSVLELGPETVVITDGRNGAYSGNGKELVYAPMFTGERVEATGAGDAFSSGFLGSFMEDGNIHNALSHGAVNSANVVQFVGGIKGLLNKEEIEERLINSPGYKTENLPLTT